MITALTLLYLACFQLCTWPQVIRMWRRRSSQDLSIWREVLLLIGVGAQFAVMVGTGADWRVCVSPILSGVSVGLTLVVIYRFR